MAHPNLPNDERTNPAGVDAGPQSGQRGAGGEPKGARLEAQAQDHHSPRATQSGPQPPREHSSGKANPGYRARPAGQSGLGAQDDLTSTLRDPQGDGNYIATDRGDKPLRNG